MRKNIWILNHYATNMYFEEAGRHYWFAKNLIEEGYKPTIFCSSTNHISDNHINTEGKKFIMKTSNGIPFVFINNPLYKGCYKQRIVNMISFYKGIFSSVKEVIELNGRPDVIIASSPHPLTLIAGIKIAKRLNISCICEIRDLWPESFVAYKIIKKKNPILKILYLGEKWIYNKADKIIFTMEGGRDYIIEKGWNQEKGGRINLNKVYHINNGIDLEMFDYNKRFFILEDEDLNNTKFFKVIYTGSVRLINKVEIIVDVAKCIKDKDVKFLIWGDGSHLEHLKQKVIEEKIDNIYFKGYVQKRFIPFILSKAHLNIILGENNNLYNYGISPNKLFDYFASGKPVLSTFKTGYSLIERYKAGLELECNNKEKIIENILYFKDLDNEKYNNYSRNARKAATDYNYKNLTKTLISIIES